MRSLSSILTGIAGVWGDLTDQEQANLAKTIAGTNQYSKLQTIMAGCSEAAAEGGQSFSDYTAALNNCAGSADKMAGTMLDNMNGRLVLMQSAADGLKIAIGEDLTPPCPACTMLARRFWAGCRALSRKPRRDQGHCRRDSHLGGLAGAITAVNAALKLSKGTCTHSDYRCPCVGHRRAGCRRCCGAWLCFPLLLTIQFSLCRNDHRGSEHGQCHEKEAGTDYDTTLSSMEATASVADQYIGKLEAIEAATGGNTAGNTEYHDTLCPPVCAGAQSGR